MPKQNVQIDVPKEVKGKAKQEYLATTRELLKEQTVLRLFEEGKASAGFAANLLGLNRYEFDYVSIALRASNRNFSRRTWSVMERSSPFREAAFCSFRGKHCCGMMKRIRTPLW